MNELDIPKRLHPSMSDDPFIYKTCRPHCEETVRVIYNNNRLEVSSTTSQGILRTKLTFEAKLHARMTSLCKSRVESYSPISHSTE